MMVSYQNATLYGRYHVHVIETTVSKATVVSITMNAGAGSKEGVNKWPPRAGNAY